MTRRIFLSLTAASLLAAFPQMHSIATADVFANVPEARTENYRVLYELTPPIYGGFRDSTAVPYHTDNHSTVPDFDRVAYYLELTGDDGVEWIYVSMDVFTDDPVELGLPHNQDNPVVHQRTVHNMNVASNVPGIVTGSFIDTGNIEMWPGDYRSKDENGVFAADDDLYDWGDAKGSPLAGYGSFQIHNAVARQTLLAYNRWGLEDRVLDDIGIGNSPTPNADWTFAGNIANYRRRKLAILVRPRAHNVSFTELPRQRQLYSRDPETNLATVPIEGSECFGGFDRIILRVSRNGLLFSETAEPLIYRNGEAPFSFETEIAAELANYDFELLLDKAGQLKTVEEVRGVVAGDAFLFYGQSNAEARSYDPTESANGYASEWLRTFGQNGDQGADAENILYWVPAEGDGDAGSPGAIGQWALVLGRNLVDTRQLPIAILNGSRGGYSMKKLQKDRLEPDNLYDEGEVTRTYNRLRHRALEAGVADTARAMFFYQGEAEADKAEVHADGFAGLREDWAVDFPGLEHFYVTQLRPGCGVTASDVTLRDTQRRFVDVYPNTSVMVTNGLLSHDGCHYGFTAGYEDLGWQYFRLVARDLYGAPNTPNIDPLHPLFAEFTDATRTTIRLVLRNHGATIYFPAGALADFALTGSTASITGHTVAENALYFHLSEPAAEDSVLEYHSHAGPGEWITNAHGVGMLSFAEPVMPFHFLGLRPETGESSWLGEMHDHYFDHQSNTGWLLHNEHGWLYTEKQDGLSGVWLWDHIQQDWLWTKAAAYPFFYRHNGGNGYWLYYRRGGTPTNRRFYDYRVNSWIHVP